MKTKGWTVGLVFLILLSSGCFKSEKPVPVQEMITTTTTSTVTLEPVTSTTTTMEPVTTTISPYQEAIDLIESNVSEATKHCHYPYIQDHLGNQLLCEANVLCKMKETNKLDEYINQLINTSTQEGIKTADAIKKATELCFDINKDIDCNANDRCYYDAMLITSRTDPTEGAVYCDKISDEMMKKICIGGNTAILDFLNQTDG